ncbi:MAG TPA: hypothetical protein VE987_01840 [Polyangiaceae bacterium]|nr:hypothetical protein [Polyangiaceae bacterium]
MRSLPADELLTSRQARERLGVRPRALYACVAPGLIRSRLAPGRAGLAQELAQ